MNEIMIENTEKTPIKVAEKYIELDYPDQMYILGLMTGILAKSNSEQTKSA